MMLFVSNKYFGLVGNAILGRKEEASSTCISTISGLFWGLSMAKIIFNIVYNALTLNSKIQLSTLRYIHDHTIE
jgi:hypothetical protein